ncbi:MAG: ABC transporter permease, partial [Ruminiclostridium sp.]|nr:ABC transporter permease [Ruminiclostridium sp.]
MGCKMIVKANMKRHKGTLSGIFILTLFAASALGTVLSVWTNSGKYIKSEIERAGFGELTAWVSGVEDISALTQSIESIPEVDRTETQALIFSNYTAKGQESDSEGQLITYSPDKKKYKFFTDDLKGYKEQPDSISKGDIYVSPSMISMFGLNIGDEIDFPVARAGIRAVFTVKGFYEDPFMGSSMIGMKGFLICRSDREEILSVIKSAGIDALARDGAMIHIFPSSELTEAELNGVINENTDLTRYAEFVHGKNAISGFMLILHNAFCGLLIAFGAVLLLVAAVVLGHSIGNTLESDTVNMGILKTAGFTSLKLQLFQLVQYILVIGSGLLSGLLLSALLSSLANGMTLTTVGFLNPADPPVILTALLFMLILLLLGAFIMLRTRHIGKISPMAAIRSKGERVCLDPKRSISAFGNAIHFRLALRQLLTGKKRYAGALITAAMLVFFAYLIVRMNSWLVPDGKGMIDAFNPD